MKLLTFLASRFAWTPFSKTLEDAPDDLPADEMEDAVVVFLHAEQSDFTEERSKRVFRHTLKHIKWLANKRELTNVVLHSFAHLGGNNADPEDAWEFMASIRERLESTGYQVKITPFGWFCSWDLQVHGESLAKVWKEI